MRIASSLIPFTLGVAFGVIALAVIMTPVLRSAAEPHVDGVAYAPSTWKVRNDATLLPTFYFWEYFISYPRDFTVDETASGTSFMDVHSINIAFPDDAFSDERTNFGGAWIAIDYDHTVPSAACLTVPNPSGTITLGNTTFTVGTQSEGAAGSAYDSTIYRAMVHDVCVEIVTTLRTSNIGNYDPGTVTEFDTAKTDVIFAAILETLTFKHYYAED